MIEPTSTTLIAIATVLGSSTTAIVTAWVTMRNAKAKLQKDDQTFQLELRTELRQERDEWRDRAEMRLAQVEQLQGEMFALRQQILELRAELRIAQLNAETLIGTPPPSNPNDD